MGKLEIQEPGGHVEIVWNEEAITIDLNPQEGKATRAERDYTLSLIQECLDKDFVAEIDGVEASEVTQITSAKKVILYVGKPNIQQMIGKLVGSEVLTNHIVYRLDKNGDGELVQKSSFVADNSNYAATAPMSGG